MAQKRTWVGPLLVCRGDFRPDYSRDDDGAKQRGQDVIEGHAKSTSSARARQLARTLEVLRLDGERWTIFSTWSAAAVVRAESFDAMELDLTLLWEIP